MEGRVARCLDSGFPKPLPGICTQVANSYFLHHFGPGQWRPEREGGGGQAVQVNGQEHRFQANFQTFLMSPETHYDYLPHKVILKKCQENHSSGLLANHVQEIPAIIMNILICLLLAQEPVSGSNFRAKENLKTPSPA